MHLTQLTTNMLKLQKQKGNLGKVELFNLKQNPV